VKTLSYTSVSIPTIPGGSEEDLNELICEELRESTAPFQSKEAALKTAKYS
jgi:hypothetical protein